MSTVAYVSRLPNCDFCAQQRRRTTALFDGATKHRGSWAYMCPRHFTEYGVGTGTGKGQRLVVGDEPPEDMEERRRKIKEAIAAGDFDEAAELIGDGDITEFV